MEYRDRTATAERTEFDDEKTEHNTQYPAENRDNSYLAAIRKATGFMVLTRLVDNLRFETTDRNSHTMQSPHPHQHCLEEIGRTGQWTPFPEDFQGGMGYNPSGQSTPSR